MFKLHRGAFRTARCPTTTSRGCRPPCDASTGARPARGKDGDMFTIHSTLFRSIVEVHRRTCKKALCQCGTEWSGVMTRQQAFHLPFYRWQGGIQSSTHSLLLDQSRVQAAGRSPLLPLVLCGNGRHLTERRWCSDAEMSQDSVAWRKQPLSN